MSFLNPFFLLGLLAVAVPVIIHFINLRRPQKVSFSTLSFFRELQKSTLRRIRIKEYLLLALRVLAVLLLALALARPYLTGDSTGRAVSDGPASIAVLIDDSPSMSRVGSEGPLSDQGRELARDIIENTRSDDRITVMTTSGSAYLGAGTNKGRALQELDSIEPLSRGSFPDEAIRRFGEQLQQSPVSRGVIYFVTDGQRHQAAQFSDLSQSGFSGEKPVSIQIVQLHEADQVNVAFSNVRLNSQMLSAGTPVELETVVTNYGEVTASNQYISAALEGRTAGQYEITLDPGETRTLTFELMPEEVGDLRGTLQIEGDEVTYDNRRNFVLHIPESRSVLLVREDQNRDSEFISYLEPVLEAASMTQTQLEFNEESSEEVQPSAFSTYDAIILDGIERIPDSWFDELQSFVQEGGGLLFMPSEQGSVTNYNRFLQQFNAGEISGVQGSYASFETETDVAGLEPGHPVLESLFEIRDGETLNVNLPQLFYYYRYRSPGEAGSYTILEAETGDPVLMEQSFGDGKVLLSAIGADPGWSNFPVNPLFAPLYYRSILYASNPDRGGLREHMLGDEFVEGLESDSRTAVLSLNGTEYRPETEVTPGGIRLRYPAREWEPGYLVVENEGEERSIAVNLDIMESDFSTLSDKDLENVADKHVTVTTINTSELNDETLHNEFNAASINEEIWHIFAWVALGLLLTETLISRWYKAETLT